jgi:hypothetical protein
MTCGGEAAELRDKTEVILAVGNWTSKDWNVKRSTGIARITSIHKHRYDHLNIQMDRLVITTIIILKIIQDPLSLRLRHILKIFLVSLR